MFDFNGKDILITGGTGSFGKAFCRHVLSRFKPRRLILFSRDELKQSLMQEEFKHPAMRFFVGDVRDSARLYRAFAGVDYVVHGAAMKQVPACEYNPLEAIRTNVLGAENVINAAIDQGVQRVVALSTDKAANPINLYGATKLCSDKLFVAANAYVGETDTRFSVVRYGNVLGSRGSIVPLIETARSKGVIPVTDPTMTRFWITLPQAVQFVLMAFSKMRGGEVFVPKIPSMKMSDFITAIAPECRQEIVGIRPGEKLHETMVPIDEARNTMEYENHFVIEPVFEWWSKRRSIIPGDAGKPVPAGFSYRSDNNTRWLTADELKALLQSTAE